MAPNATVTLGTCGVAGGYCFGDTSIALIGPPIVTVSHNGTVSSIPGGQLVSNDDGPSGMGCGTCSYIEPYTYIGTVAATLTVSMGCYMGACGGAVAVSVRNVTSPPPPALPAPPAPPVQPLSTVMCAPFTVAASQKFAFPECVVLVPPFTALVAGTCGLPGASCVNSTNLQVLDAGAQALVSNSAGAAAGCASPTGQCSLTPSWLNTGATAVNVTIRQACAAAGLRGCTGTTAVQLSTLAASPPPLPPSPPPPSPPPPTPPATSTFPPFTLGVEDDSVSFTMLLPPLTTVVLGTCSLIPFAYCTGDTYVTVVVNGVSPPIVFDSDNGPSGSCGFCSYAGPYTNNLGVVANLTATVTCADPALECGGVLGYAFTYPPPPPRCAAARAAAFACTTSA